MRNGLFGWVRRLVGRDFDCEDVLENCSDYVDGELSASVAEKFRSHLETCTDCNTFHATFRATVLTLRDLPKKQAPPELREKLRARIAAEAEAHTD